MLAIALNLQKLATQDQHIKLVLFENDKENKDLAKHLGVTPTAVSRWCTNDAQPSLSTLVEIAKYLKVMFGTFLIRL